jgi:hypothetical protein
MITHLLEPAANSGKLFHPANSGRKLPGISFVIKLSLMPCELGPAFMVFVHLLLLFVNPSETIASNYA